MTEYDESRATYALLRRPDPRIAERIERALGHARSVLNVGAGAGSYEPRDREVTAVEPSATMRAQRPPDAPPAIDARAEELPFGEASFDAAMAILTMHHWDDWAAGLRELRRVARDRVVILTYDVSQAGTLWFVRDYLPELAAVDSDRMPPIEALGGSVETVPIPHDCTDGFLGAYWRRPERYLDRAAHVGISTLAEVEPAALERALSTLRADLDSGEWQRRYADLLEREELDLGYRMVVVRHT